MPASKWGEVTASKWGVSEHGWRKIQNSGAISGENASQGKKNGQGSTKDPTEGNAIREKTAGWSAIIAIHPFF